MFKEQSFKGCQVIELQNWACLRPVMHTPRSSFSVDWLSLSLSLHTFLFWVPGKSYHRDFSEALFFCLESAFSFSFCGPVSCGHNGRFRWTERVVGVAGIRQDKFLSRTAEKYKQYGGVWVLALRHLHGPCASKWWRWDLQVLSLPSHSQQWPTAQTEALISLLDSWPHHSTFTWPWARICFCFFLKNSSLCLASHP